MTSWNHLRIRTRLSLLIAAGVVGLAAVGGVALRLEQRVAVGGPLYGQVADGKDLVADLLPPPLYLVEMYLAAHRLADLQSPAERAVVIAQIRRQRAEFDRRAAYWPSRLPDAPLRTAVTGSAVATGTALADAIERGFVPLVEAGRAAEARRYLEERIEPLFAGHRAAIEAVVGEVEAHNAALEAQVAGEVRSARVFAIAFSAVAMVILVGLGWGIVRAIARPTAELVDVIEGAAAGDLGRRATVHGRDELGRMAEALNRLVSALAVAEAERVAQAARDAEAAARDQARQAAEQLRLREESEHASLLRNVQQALGMARTTEDAAATVLESVRREFGWSYASFWQRDRATEELVFALESGVVSPEFARASRQARFREGTGVNGRAWRARDLVVVRDLGEVADCPRRDSAVRAGVRSGVSFPVSIGGEVVGTFDFFATEVREPSPARLEALRQVAGIASAGLARVAADERERAEAEGLQRKVDAILEVVEAAAGGDLTRRVPVRGQDAIGRLGERLEHLMASLRESLAAVAGGTGSLAGASDGLRQTARELLAGARDTALQAESATAGASQVSASLQSLASATEEMTAAVREIAKSATDATRVAQQAVRTAQNASTSVSRLGESSAEIEQIIKLITSVAQQTNLLALNATIEAARAGEAGKGFAVVANEVKELANQTSRATESIGRKIGGIQTDVRDAVEAIRGIDAIIAQIDQLQASIATAVEEQSATTNEMARNVGEAAKAATEITDSVGRVADTARSAQAGAEATAQRSAELDGLAGELRRQLGRFQVAGAEPVEPALARTLAAR